MKKNKLLKTVLATLLVAFSGYSVYISNNKPNNYSSLQLENIEVLAQQEDAVELTCTRVKQTQNCYRDRNGRIEFAGVSVIEVEEYKVTSLMIPCAHAVVYPCPPGTFSIRR